MCVCVCILEAPSFFYFYHSKPISTSQVKQLHRVSHNTHILPPPSPSLCPSQASQHPASPSVQKTCALKLQCVRWPCGKPFPPARPLHSPCSSPPYLLPLPVAVFAAILIQWLALTRICSRGEVQTEVNKVLMRF